MSAVFLNFNIPNAVFDTTNDAQSTSSSTFSTSGFYLVSTTSYSYYFTNNLIDATGSNDILMSDGYGALIANAAPILPLTTSGTINTNNLPSNYSNNPSVITLGTFSGTGSTGNPIVISNGQIQSTDTVLWTFESMASPDTTEVTVYNDGFSILITSGIGSYSGNYVVLRNIS